MNSTHPDHFNDVLEFTRKIVPQKIGTSPRLLEDDDMQRRVDFLYEEMGELLESCDNGFVPGIADALVDIVYVAIGTAVMMGLPWNELWRDVQRANMAKVPGATKSCSKSASLKARQSPSTRPSRPRKRRL